MGCAGSSQTKGDVASSVSFYETESWAELNALALVDDPLLQQHLGFYSNNEMSHSGSAKYELPKYVLSEPTNLIRDG
ncbi:hypothetical protein F8388_000510 [Cannabis sativa]|uniref:Uncharacterized protein n=1 Tax=Cannabis sativa TaxID=3483 RepID=A0A7J6ED33_CANSA|nr:hypothetical protein G4B88_002833 [Cannabis sativa]KAF4363845.1 hypothetical protein F8388_000510 [Cannabis sativa]